MAIAYVNFAEKKITRHFKQVKLGMSILNITPGTSRHISWLSVYCTVYFYLLQFAVGMRRNNIVLRRSDVI